MGSFIVGMNTVCGLNYAIVMYRRIRGHENFLYLFFVDLLSNALK